MGVSWTFCLVTTAPVSPKKMKCRIMCTIFFYLHNKDIIEGKICLANRPSLETSLGSITGELVDFY
jgi:hypothetical protein